jgi:hypothetical protein
LGYDIEIVDKTTNLTPQDFEQNQQKARFLLNKKPLILTLSQEERVPDSPLPLGEGLGVRAYFLRSYV